MKWETLRKLLLNLLLEKGRELTKATPKVWRAVVRKNASTVTI